MVEWTNLKETVARTFNSKNCPNCGAPIESEKCPYCGSVFVDFACMDADKPFYIKIKYGDTFHIARVRLNRVDITNTDEAYYADNFTYFQRSSPTEIDMNFIIM